MNTLRQVPITCTGHTRPVVDLRFSDITPCSYFLVSACKDGLPMLREGDTGDYIGTFDGHKGAVWSATLNRHASRVATGAADFTAKLWDAQTGSEIHSFEHKHIVKSVDFSSDSKQLITGCNDKNLRLFDLENYDSEPKVFTGYTASIKKAIFSNDNSKILSISEDKTLKVWDSSNTDKEIQSLTFDQVPNSLEMSKNGKMLVISLGNFVEFYDSQTLDKIYSYKMACPIYTASMHPTENVFVCGGENFILYKYSIDTGVELESCKGHFGPVHCVQFSPDGELYASGSEDGTLRLWQTTIGKTYGLWKCVDVSDEDNGMKLTSNSSENLVVSSS